VGLCSQRRRSLWVKMQTLKAKRRVPGQIQNTTGPGCPGARPGSGSGGPHLLSPRSPGRQGTEWPYPRGVRVSHIALEGNRVRVEGGCLGSGHDAPEGTEWCRFGWDAGTGVTIVTKESEGQQNSCRPGRLSFSAPRAAGSRGSQEGRQVTLPGRPPGLAEDRPRWAPRPQYCRGLGLEPAGTQRQAEGTRLGTR
jgi:hypothetical protein